MKSAPRILFIALFRGIGDAVLFWPTLKRCAEMFPESEIGLLLYRKGIEEVMRLYGFTGPVWSMPQSSIGLVPFVFRVGLRRYTIVIDASSVDQMHVSRWLALAFSKGDRVGYHYGSSSWLYNVRLATKPIAQAHQKDIFAQMLAPYTKEWGVELVPPPDSPLLRGPGPVEKPRHQRVVVHVGWRDPSGGLVRSWPVDRYGKLVELIAAKGGMQTILIGEARMRGPYTAAGGMLEGNGVIDLLGKTSIAQQFQIIRDAKVFIGNKSGPMHIASAYGVPIVTFAGGVPVRQWGPLPAGRSIVLGTDKMCAECQEWNCDRHGIPCLGAITVDEALAAVEAQLT